MDVESIFWDCTVSYLGQDIDIGRGRPRSLTISLQDWQKINSKEYPKTKLQKCQGKNISKKYQKKKFTILTKNKLPRKAKK